MEGCRIIHQTHTKTNLIVLVFLTYLIDCCFSTTSGPDQHDTMSDLQCLKELNNFLDLFLQDNKILLFNYMDYFLLESSIVMLWNFYARE